MPLFSKRKGPQPPQSPSGAPKRSTVLGTGPSGLHNSFMAPPNMLPPTAPGNSALGAHLKPMAPASPRPVSHQLVVSHHTISTPPSQATELPPITVPGHDLHWKGYKLIDKVLFPRQDFSVAYDGKRAFIFGGRHVGNYYNDLTAFNPKTLEFTPVETTGPPPSPRSGHTAIFIGRAMLIFGGRLEDGSFDDQNVYMYTVQHSRWFPLAPEGPALSGRKGHACSLYGHAMCVSFGFTASGTINDVALFDLRTVKQGGPRWQVLTPATEAVPPSRAYHSSCIQDHKLYVFGGCNGDVFYNDLWAMDLTTSTWTLLRPQGQAPMPRANHSAFLIDGYMVVTGGHLGNAKVCRETFAYSIADNCWYYANHTDRSWTRRPNGRFLATRDRLFYLGGIVPEGELPYVVFTALSSRPILTNDVFSPVTSATSLPSFTEKRDGPADQSQSSFRLDGTDSGPASQNLSLATQSFTKGLGNARPADSSDSPILNATVAGQSLLSLSLVGNDGERRSALQQSVNSLTSFTGQVDDVHRSSISQERNGSRAPLTTATSQQVPSPSSPTYTQEANAGLPPFAEPRDEMASKDMRRPQPSSDGSLPSPKDSTEQINGDPGDSPTFASPIPRSYPSVHDRSANKRLTIELRNRVSLIRSPSLEVGSPLGERIAQSDPDLTMRRTDSATSLSRDRRPSTTASRSPLAATDSLPTSAEPIRATSPASDGGASPLSADLHQRVSALSADPGFGSRKSSLRQEVQPVTVNTTASPRSSAADGRDEPSQEIIRQGWQAVQTVVQDIPDNAASPHSSSPDGDSRRLSRTPSFPRNVFSDDQIQAIQTDPLKLKLLQTLTYLHRELAESKGAVNSLSSTVVERIAEAERARQNALQEAMYLRAKCQALEEANADLLLHAEVARTSVLEKQLANLINDNNALRTQLHEATTQLDQTRQRLNDTHRHHTTSDQAYTDMEELYSQAQGDLGALTQQNAELVQQHTQHLDQLQSLRAEVDAQTQAKQMLEGELTALKASDKKTQQVIQSTLAATTAGNQRVQQLQQQLTQAQADVDRLEAANRDLLRHAEDQTAALTRATSRCDELVAQRDAAAAQVDCLQALTTLVEETDMKEEMIAKLEEQIGQSATRIRKLEQELGQAHGRLKAYRLTFASSPLPSRAESPRLVRRDSATAGTTNSSSPDLSGKGGALDWPQRLRQLESRYLQSQRDASRAKHDLTRLRQDVRASDEKRLVAETQLQRRDMQLEDIRTKVQALLYHLQVSGNPAARDDRSASPTRASTQELARHLERLLQTPQQRHVPISTGALLDVASLRSLMLSLEQSISSRSSDSGAAGNDDGSLALSSNKMALASDARPKPTASPDNGRSGASTLAPVPSQL
ncbi:hypothetical protein H4R35_001555 [Dimargaris xerosporica]|nr:hypothetical protein H4R35_001555 [Dimargaris xerosporica]